MNKRCHNYAQMMNFNDKLIERYLRDEMDTEEKIYFYDKIKTHPLIKARAELISALVRGVKRLGKKMPKIR